MNVCRVCVSVIIAVLLLCGCGKIQTTEPLVDEILVESSAESLELVEGTSEVKCAEPEANEESVVEEVNSESFPVVIDEIRDMDKKREIEMDKYRISMGEVSASSVLKNITDSRVQINVPDFMYNEGMKDDEKKQELINTEIHTTSVGEHLEILTSDDLSDLYEYQVDYVISKADEDVISIQYQGHIYTIANGMTFSRGITINTFTGEKIPVEQYLCIDEKLLEDVMNGKMKFTSSAEYEVEDMLYYFEMFISDYASGYVDVFTCYFLDDRGVNLIVPIQGGNSGYFVVESYI